VKVRGYRIELGEIESVLAEHPQVSECVVKVWEGRAGGKQLVAYVVAAQQILPSVQDMRRYMQERMPKYMVPVQIVLLEALPLAPNGKIDREALPVPSLPDAQEDTAFFAPRTTVEKELAAIWADVLGLQQVGIRDNFFELGGDSIISIQIIARARQKGLRITLKHLFQYPTIEELSFVVHGDALVQAEQGLVLGSVPLTPIQHWFFDLHFPVRHHFNQALFFEIKERLYSSFFEEVVKIWLQHHDALRLHFTLDNGEWHQYIADVEELRPLMVVDLSHLTVDEQKEAATQRAAEAQASLDIAEGPLMRMLLFDMGKERAQCVLIIVHHLAIDGVSWRILLEDLETAYWQVKRGHRIELPPKTSSFKTWAQRLVEYAQSEALQREQAYWLADNLAQAYALPLDFPCNRQANIIASARTISASLTREETKAFLEDVPVTYHTQINDILVTALAKTFKSWTGSSALLLDLEGHGREDLFEDIDISRTVGWFTSMFPVYISLAETSSLEEEIQAVKEQLQAIPKHGIGYGILRYLSTDRALIEEFRARPQVEVSFNYLGQFNQASSVLVSESRLSVGPTRNAQGRRTHLLEIDCYISENQFHVTWSYSEYFHQYATIEGLVTAFTQALRAIISHGGASRSENSLTISSKVKLSQEQLEQIALEMDLD
jgi:non-ribosomal peptide synthase protein (TIGR01720 family)